MDGIVVSIRGDTQLLDEICVGIMDRCFPSQCVLFVLSGKRICRVPFTWDMTYLQVVPLQDANPLLDTGVDARLIRKVTERSMVCLYNYGAGPSTIVLPLG